MHRIMRTMRIALLGAATAAMFVATPQGQSILGPASEANHFIETPKGWVHPKRPWGPRTAADREGRVRPGAPLGCHRPEHTAAADHPHRGPTERLAAGSHPGRKAPRARDAQRLVAARRV